MRCNETWTDLVQVGQAVRVLAQPLILSPEPISCRDLPELLQVHHVEGAVEHSAGDAVKRVFSPWRRHGYLPDVVLASRQVAGPVARLPEAVAVHLPAALAERRVAVRRPLQVEVAQLLQVRAHNLAEKTSSFLRKENVSKKPYLFIKPVMNYPIKSLLFI